MLKIDKTLISSTSPSYIIGEIGSNHQQSISIAKESIDALTEIGVNAVKFQSINILELYYKPEKNIRNLHKKIDFNEKWHNELKNYSTKKKVTFISSPTYINAINILEKINVKAYKIASAQTSVFPQLVEKVAKINKPTFISTGLIKDSELNEIIKIFKTYKNKKYIIMYCNSVYPTPPEIVHIKRISKLINNYRCLVGYSDHTVSETASLAALSLGARVFEKHFKLDNSIKSPDAHFSLNPKNFSNYVKKIREFEKLFNYKEKKLLENQENKFKKSIKYYLFAKQNLKKNQVIKIDNINFLRHSFKEKNTALSANDIFFKRVLLKNNLKKNDYLKKSDVKILKRKI